MKDPERDDLTVAIAEAHPTLPWSLCCAIAETVIREGWAPERIAPGGLAKETQIDNTNND